MRAAALLLAVLCAGCVNPNETGFNHWGEQAWNAEQCDDGRFMVHCPIRRSASRF